MARNCKFLQITQGWECWVSPWPSRYFTCWRHIGNKNLSMSSDQSHFTESEMQAVSFKWRFKSVTPTDPPAGDDKKHVWRYRSAKWLPTGWSYFASSPEPNIGLQFGGFFTKLCLIKSFSGIISDDSYNMSQRQLDFTRFKIVFFIGHSL